jgi:hypothetical protein
MRSASLSGIYQNRDDIPRSTHRNQRQKLSQCLNETITYQELARGFLLPVSGSMLRIVLASILLGGCFCSAKSGVAVEPVAPQLKTVTVLGQPCEKPYVVAIPETDPGLLDRVQAWLPTAFLTQSQFGLYVLAGSFSEWQVAELLNRQLQQRGFDSRVLYKPVPCSAQLP